ncbi:SH2 domain-containing protein [Schistosoma japonicum]|nr:SH2 domain-containing protein [Schistosoma japonicum]KAH8874053.1 SH2 domain-containing protein [Schistosoma japonicum]
MYISHLFCFFNHSLILKNNLTETDTDDKLNNSDHSGRRVSYLCGPDGKLLVTTATAPDYDRTNQNQLRKEHKQLINAI